MGTEIQSKLESGAHTSVVDIQKEQGRTDSAIGLSGTSPQTVTSGSYAPTIVKTKPKLRKIHREKMEWPTLYTGYGNNTLIAYAYEDLVSFVEVTVARGTFVSGQIAV